jgi:hypothetical protein
MKFDIAGPFELMRFGKITKILTAETEADLKQKLSDWDDRLPDACGCYVFATKAGGGYTPHYVGQACSSTILKESLNPSNLGKYNKVCSNLKGTPVLFFLPMLTPTGLYRKRGKISRPAMDFLERWLIAAALEKNSELVNNKETHFLRNIHVVGVFNAKKGEANDASRQLTKALGL